MPSNLKKGIGTIRPNVQQLVNLPVVSPARRKAIMTLAKKHNISFTEAQFRQAVAIAKGQSRK